jgi:MFS family permease
MPLALYALAVATFAIGTTEFVVVGLIPAIAADLGVSIATAGLLVSVYALAITLGTPTLSALTGAIPRRELAIALMVVFTACNFFAAIAPSYSTLLLSRVVMAVAHGVFFGVGAACATSLVPKSRSGSAVAVMMGGLTVAMVIGVPLGSWIGQIFGWRAPFLIVTGMGSIAVVCLVWLLPHEISYQRPAPFAAQLGLLGNRHLASMYLLTAIAFGGTFVVFTFLSPLLTDVTGLPNGTVNIALLLFGAASVVGNLSGGKLIDAVGTPGDDDSVLRTDRFLRPDSIGDPPGGRDLCRDRNLGSIRVRHPAGHAGRRCGDSQASSPRRACNRFRLQHRSLQPWDINRFFDRRPALEGTRTFAHALRCNRHVDNRTVDRDVHAPRAVVRRPECRIGSASKPIR